MVRETSVEKAGLLKWCPVLLALDMKLSEQREHQGVIDIRRKDRALDRSSLDRILGGELSIGCEPTISFKYFKRTPANNEGFQQTTIAFNILTQLFDVFEITQLLFYFLLSSLPPIRAHNRIHTRVIGEEPQFLLR